MTQVLTPSQFGAARMLISRLRSEAAGEHFLFGDIGMVWVENHDQVVIVTDEGQQILASDVLYAAMVLLWSLANANAAAEVRDVADTVAALGMNLAKAEVA